MGGAAATIGAIIGDTIGYTIGRRIGMPLFEKLGKRFPKHFGPGHVDSAKQLLPPLGWAVFFGRFIALLRIPAGPLAGALRMRCPYFLGANATGQAVPRRHHRGGLLPRPGRREVAVALLVGRPRCWRSSSASE